MTIQQCKYVLEIMKTGSFNEAAKQLFIAQSSLSTNIKNLEQELDIQIFERSKNGVWLTKEGAEFVKYAGRIVNEFEIASMRYSYKKEYNRLSIVTQRYDFIADIFCKMLNNTDADNYRFSLREIKTYDVIREIETAHSDIGIIAIKNNDFDIMKRYLTTKNITFTPFIKAYPRVILSKDHPLALTSQLSSADLKEYPYVAYEQGQSNVSFFTEEIFDDSHSSRYIEISDRATLMNMLMTTKAYTIGTGIMPSALNRGDIVSVPLESDEYYNVGYILNDEKRVSPLAKLFIDLLVETIKEI